MTQVDSQSSIEAPRRPAAMTELAADPASRGRFLRTLGVGAAGAFATVLAACGGGDGPSGASAPVNTSRQQPPPSDLEIVNYALTLEYLERDFYDRVLASGLTSGRALEVIKVVDEHEREHVRRLTSVANNLGKPVRRPKTKFPLDNQDQILKLASTFENLGAAAYIGQAPFIRDKELLSEATSIATVEARHAAELNRLIGKTPTPDGSFEKALPMRDVLAKASPYLVSA